MAGGKIIFALPFNDLFSFEIRFSLLYISSVETIRFRVQIELLAFLMNVSRLCKGVIVVIVKLKSNSVAEASTMLLSKEYRFACRFPY